MMWQQIKDRARAHSNLVSLATFSLFLIWLCSLMEWPVALMLSVSLAIHEYSHVWAMKRIGMRIEGVIFVPFFGAMALGGGGKILNRKQEYLVALAGPLMGYLSALPVIAALILTGEKIFFKTAYFIILLNLFNMVPLSPLDGGRMIKSILMSLKNKILGFAILGAVGIYVLVMLYRVYISPFILVLIAWMAMSEFMNEWRTHKICKEAEEILSRYKGLSAEEARQRFETEYSENKYIVLYSDRIMKNLTPLNLKQGMFFTLAYIVLAGWPLALYLLMR